MGRVLPLRRRRSPMYAVKETVAALNEELEFTLNYAEALSRDNELRAAAEVIEEQRRALQRASEQMQLAIREPARKRTRSRVTVAIAGVAAAVAIASSAVAAFGPRAHQPAAENPRVAAITQATAALAQTTTISDPATLQAIVLDAGQKIIAAAEAAAADPNLRAPLLDSIEKLRAIARDPNVPARVRAQAKRAAETVKSIVVAVPQTDSSSSSTSSSGSSTDSTSTTDAPSASTTPSSPSTPAP